jgi:short-subunit dehydrogenase
VRVVSADLSTRKGIDELWQKIMDLGQPLNVACISAGIGVEGLFTETDLETELR